MIRHTIRSKLCSALALVAFAAAPALAQENPIQEMQACYDRAMEQLQAKKYDEAIDSYARGLEILESLDVRPEAKQQYRSLAHYNTACALSLQGKIGPALDHLDLAIAHGFTDVDHMNKDTDLDNLRNEERFKAAMARAAGADSGSKDEQKREEAAALDAAKKELVSKISKDRLFDFAFDLETVKGERVNLGELKGNVVLVDVWGTWCPPCRREVPHLVDLYTRYKDKGFRIVGLNSEKVAPEKQKETVVDFIGKNGIEYPCALTPREVINTIPDFKGFPTLLLVDREGRVRLMRTGYTEGEVLEAAIQALLAETAPAEKQVEKKPTGKGQEF